MAGSLVFKIDSVHVLGGAEKRQRKLWGLGTRRAKGLEGALISEQGQIVVLGLGLRGGRALCGE